LGVKHPAPRILFIHRRAIFPLTGTLLKVPTGKIRATSNRAILIHGGPFSMTKPAMKWGTGKKARLIPEKPCFTKNKLKESYMSKKFDDVPVDEDTRIMFRQEAGLGKFDVLYEKWSWEGISAESIIFANDDVADMTDNELEQEVRKSPLVKKESDITIKRLDVGFTFVNFNFET